VPVEVIDTALRNAVRAPSTGFNQGWDFVVLYAGQVTGRATSASVPCDVVPEESVQAAGFLKVIQATEVLLSASANALEDPATPREQPAITARPIGDRSRIGVRDDHRRR
jgi:nitroreductase